MFRRKSNIMTTKHIDRIVEISAVNIIQIIIITILNIIIIMVYLPVYRIGLSLFEPDDQRNAITRRRWSHVAW